MALVRYHDTKAMTTAVRIFCHPLFTGEGRFIPVALPIGQLALSLVYEITIF
jgi:ribosomal protein L31